MPKTSDASSFTHFQKVNAQSLTTTGKKTASTAVPVVNIVAAIAKASVVAAAAAPKTTIVEVSKLVTSTKKRG
jgi:hypothetical protein